MHDTTYLIHSYMILNVRSVELVTESCKALFTLQAG